MNMAHLRYHNVSLNFYGIEYLMKVNLSETLNFSEKFILEHASV